MKTEKNSVVDGKLTNEQIGKLDRKLREIIRRVEEGTISYEDSIAVMQKIIIEGKSPQHLGVINGSHEIKMIEHFIDLDTNPFIPGSWTVEEHKKGGLYKFDPSKISFYLSEKQKEGSSKGYDLRKELEGRPVMNANVLDYLLAHTELISEEWKDKYIFFWGTIYCSSGGDLCVRYLDWDGSDWSWFYHWLGHDFDSGDHAALAS
jgi:hypothetical protein